MEFPSIILPEGLLMIARMSGVTECLRAVWRVELHLGTDACCIEITNALADLNPPSIEIAWTAAQRLSLNPCINFPKSFHP